MNTKNVKLGVYSGLTGGVVFGVMMGDDGNVAHESERWPATRPLHSDF